MPLEIYSTLYNQHDLNTVITMVKDIYAKKPEPANLPATTGGAVAPFTLIKAPNGSSKRVHFQDGESLSDRTDRIAKLTETLYWMDMEGKPPKWLYEPYITSPRCRGGRSGFRPRGGHSSSDHGEGWPRLRGRFRGGFSHRGRSQGRKFDKSPPQKDPEYLAKLKTKTKTAVTIATSEDTLQLNAQRKIRVSLRNLLRERSLKIILMPMEVQKNPNWPWPQSCPRPMKKP